jgi:hypothetical protein
MNAGGRIHWGRIVAAAFFAINKTFAEPPLYIVAHAIKILGGITGGKVAEQRKRRVTISEAAHV